MSCLIQAENRDELFDTNNGNGVEHNFENGVEPLMTHTSAAEICQEIVNFIFSNVANSKFILEIKFFYELHQSQIIWL